MSHCSGQDLSMRNLIKAYSSLFFLSFALNNKRCKRHPSPWTQQGWLSMLVLSTFPCKAQSSKTLRMLRITCCSSLLCLCPLFCRVNTLSELKTPKVVLTQGMKLKVNQYWNDKSPQLYSKQLDCKLAITSHDRSLHCNELLP